MVRPPERYESPADYAVTEDVPDPYTLEGIQDVEDPAWFPFTTDGAMTFDEQRHGTQGILTTHGWMDLLGHLKEDSAEEIRHWLEGDADVDNAPGWLAKELIPLFKQSWIFEMQLQAITGQLTTAGSAQYTIDGTFPFGPRQGRAWIVLNMGGELSAASFVHVYKGVVGAVGANKIVGHVTTNNSAVWSLQYAKGQLTLHNGQPLTWVSSTTNLMSVYMTGVDLPANRIAEFIAS